MAAFFSRLYIELDAFLILFYRISGHPVLDYFIGTACIGFLCVVVGELSVSLALKYNQRLIDRMSQEADQKERMSIEAYRQGDKASYKALNKAATDAWGKHFFTMVGYSAGILWPIPFALGWMQARFGEVDFLVAWPLSLLFDGTVGYTFSFIPIYILCRIIFKYLRPYLPYFKGVQTRLNNRSRGASS
jgi:hypothetical protein